MLSLLPVAVITLLSLLADAKAVMSTWKRAEISISGFSSVSKLTQRNCCSSSGAIGVDSILACFSSVEIKKVEY